jgi:uncharacterized protein with beta-barrel porin domain
VTNAIENERWRVADRAADSLSVDREACRRAFHQEPEERVREAVRARLRADDRRLGPRAQRRRLWQNGRREGGLEHVEGIVARSVWGRYAAAS